MSVALPLRVAGTLTCSSCSVCQRGYDAVCVVWVKAALRIFVDLSQCELTKFPDGLFMLMQNKTVQDLNLSGNKLKNLSPKIMQHWNEIKELDVSDNDMSSLPDQLQNLTRLKTLCIKANHFTHIPLVVFSLGNLESLVASHNQIDAVAAEELKSMNSLKFVDLRENPLSDNLKSQLLEREDWRLLI
ncbi:hypothetical protein LSH36_26g15163 [Paralvinella palmiformis]|uniref:Uncharacterized protein n=1 Tax=Paralvinella palmiformis TaxID=53620 RepID=A0AAD9KA56_9ANNE|nr:hypothetical protein LSH36_26g15163 [Paralvinella palmiformis]